MESGTGEARISWRDRFERWSARREGALIFVVVLAGLLSGVAWYHGSVVQVSSEAVVRAGVAGDLLGGEVSGRQGLIGSPAWAPLPTLLGLPFAGMGWVGRSGLGYAALGAGLSAFTVTLLNRWLRGFGLGRLVRYVVLIGYQMSPAALGAALSGSNAMLLTLLMAAGVHFLVDWWRTGELRSLGYVGVIGALAVVTDWRMSWALTGAVALVAARVASGSKQEGARGYGQAMMLVAAVPGLYVSVVWTVSNWLIMGDPFFYLRGLAGGAWVFPTGRPGGGGWHVYASATGIVILGWCYSVLREQGGTRAKWAGLCMAGLLAVVAAPYAVELGTDGSYFEAWREEARTVDEVVSYVEGLSPEARVVVTGYSGYELTARSRRSEMFVHILNLSLSEVDHRAGGKELFLLLARPKGRRSWDDLALNHPGLWEGWRDYRMTDDGFVSGFVFEKSWPGGEGQPEWLLLRMVVTNGAM